MFNHTSVKSRLSVLIGIFSIGIIILFIQGTSALRNVEAAATLMGNGKDIVADILPPPLYLIEAQLVTNEIMQAPMDERRALAERFRQLHKDYDDRNAYWKSKSADLDRDILANLFGKQKDTSDAYWLVLEQKFLPAVLSGDESQAHRALGELKVLYSEHRTGVDATVKAASAWADARNIELGATVKSSIYMFLAVALVSVAIGVAVAMLTVRAIVNPLKVLQETMSTVEQTSDFTMVVPVQSHDEVGKTAEAFNRLSATLRDALRHIQEGVGQLSEAAVHLSSSSQHVASSSALQSESASAMAATLEQVMVSIGHISSNAKEADGASRRSGDLSREGGAVIRNAASGMTAIADTVRHISSSIKTLGNQSTQITSVVQVIKDVADQTNLLALNAAIEAARAGEQGRGFAVVADEVRKLAERTAQATGEIGKMISAMQSSSEQAVSRMSSAVDQATDGVALAEQADNAIKQIEAGVNEVVVLVNSISSSLAEQSMASNDIANHVEKVARMTEENSASAGTTASSAVQLGQLACGMRQIVNRFRI